MKNAISNLVIFLLLHARNCNPEFPTALKPLKINPKTKEMHPLFFSTWQLCWQKVIYTGGKNVAVEKWNTPPSHSLSTSFSFVNAIIFPSYLVPCAVVAKEEERKKVKVRNREMNRLPLQVWPNFYKWGKKKRKHEGSFPRGKTWDEREMNWGKNVGNGLTIPIQKLMSGRGGYWLL